MAAGFGIHFPFAGYPLRFRVSLKINANAKGYTNFLEITQHPQSGRAKRIVCGALRIPMR
jgi:hypothetical protein